MTGSTDAPAFVMSLPAAFRRQIQKQCDGDWRRVTMDDRGAIVVHNKPQREHIADEVAAVVAASVVAAAAPEPTPMPPPRPIGLRPAPRPVIDTSGFVVTTLPPVIPGKRTPKKTDATKSAASPTKAAKTKKTAQKAPEPPKPAPELEPADDDRTAPATGQRLPLGQRLTNVRDLLTAPVTPPPRATPATIARPTPRPMAPARPLPNRPALEPAPAAEKKVRKRSGKPRSAVELLKRLLDLGCTYKRIPHSTWATVRYQGQALGTVHAADSTPLPLIHADYAKMLLNIATATANHDGGHPATTQEAGSPPRRPTTGHRSSRREPQLRE